MMFFSLIILIIIIVFIFNRQGNIGTFNSRSRVESNNALEILNERLANGEISVEEYIRKKELILKN